MIRTTACLTALLALSATCAIVEPATASSSVPYHSEATFLDFSWGCKAVATPASGKKLQITLVRINIGPSYSNQAGIVLYRDAACLHAVAIHVPSSTGLVVVPFNPGLDLPVNAPLMAQVWRPTLAQVNVDGYQITP